MKGTDELRTKSKMAGLAWLPMWSRSLNPLVMRSPVGSPFRSSRAFVATVVPILIDSIRLESMGDDRESFLPVSWIGNMRFWAQ